MIVMDVPFYPSLSNLPDKFIKMTDPTYLKDLKEMQETEKIEKEYKNTNIGCQTIYNFVNNLLYYQIEEVTQLVGEMKGTSKKDVLCVQIDEFVFEVAKTEGIYQKGYDIIIRDKEIRLPIAVGGGIQTNWLWMNDKLPFVVDKKAGISSRHLLLLNPENYASKYLLYIIENYQEKIKQVRQKREMVSEERMTKMEEKYKLKWESIQSESEGDNKNVDGL